MIGLREVMLILHMIGMAMGLGTGFAFAFLGKTMSEMSDDEVLKFMSKIKILNRMGDVGTGLLIISGIYMIIPYHSSLLSMPTLMAKLIAFILLTIIVAFINIYTKKALNNQDVSYLAKVEKLGKISLPLGLLIVVLAVATFY